MIFSQFNFYDAQKKMNCAGPSSCKGKRSSEHLDNNNDYISSEIDETEEEEELEDELEHSDSEFFQPPLKKHRSNKKSTKERRRSKAKAKVRQSANQQEEVSGNVNNETSIRVGSVTVISGIPESEVPKGSFVWSYFRRSEDLILSTCAVIMPDGKECGVFYKDGSTTTNLINHLARIHKVSRPTERKM